MPDIVCLHSKDDVESFCRRNPFLHAYSLGDLDDFFWPHTTWYALRDDQQTRELVLFYTGCSLPTVLALSEGPTGSMCDLLGGLLPFLPRRFYAHLTNGLAHVLAADYHVEPHGPSQKMGLVHPERLTGVDVSETVALSAADIADLHDLYDVSYPGNWFVPRMLETGHYYGIRRGATLLSVAGVHVVSEQYKVAALGNITTRPQVRGQGLATRVVARVCQQLLRTRIECIGLNVKSDNPAAIACYQRLGFERVVDYGEYTLDLK